MKQKLNVLVPILPIYNLLDPEDELLLNKKRGKFKLSYPFSLELHISRAIFKKIKREGVYEYKVFFRNSIGDSVIIRKKVS